VKSGGKFVRHPGSNPGRLRGKHRFLATVISVNNLTNDQGMNLDHDQGMQLFSSHWTDSAGKSFPDTCRVPCVHGLRDAAYDQHGRGALGLTAEWKGTKCRVYSTPRYKD
jgi:hypothetical protein